MSAWSSSNAEAFGRQPAF